MTLGRPVPDFRPALHPKGITLEGQYTRLEPLEAKRHAAALFEANRADRAGLIWHYLPYGPFEDLAGYQDWIASMQGQTDPAFFAIIRRADHRPVGVASFLRIHPEIGTIEVGHIAFSPLLQRTKEASEAMFLMMEWAFENGYRRYEWKCDALNLKSRRAAQRLGLSYEGVFRQASIVKGRNRDTAWFAAIDSEWPALKLCFDTYLAASNSEADGSAHISLTALTAPLLARKDDGAFSTPQ